MDIFGTSKKEWIVISTPFSRTLEKILENVKKLLKRRDDFEF